MFNCDGEVHVASNQVHKGNPSFEPLLALDKSKVSSCGGMDEGDDITMEPTSFFITLGNSKENTSTKMWNFI
jgi:hypothetical protein